MGFLKDFISEEKVAQRYANTKLGTKKGHRMDLCTSRKPIQLREWSTSREFEYSEPADKWSMFDEPRIAEAELSGASRVKSGDETDSGNLQGRA